MLQYSLVTTAADRYGDFGDIGAACLRRVAENHGVALDEDAAKRAVSAIRSLPWPPQGTPALPTGPTASRFEEMPDIPRPEADIGRSR